MSARVLQKHGIDCSITYTAKLDGYSLSISPRVNLTPDNEACSYGGLALVDPSDIAMLYGGLKRDFDIDYFPYPVVVEMWDKSTRVALCYISSESTEEAPDLSYINEMEKCAKEMGAPQSYISHIKSFAKY